MNDGGRDPPAPKRRKILLEGPSGFEKSKPPSRSKPVSFQRPELVPELQQSHDSLPARGQGQTSKPLSSRQRTVTNFEVVPEFGTKNAPRANKPLSDSVVTRRALPSFVLSSTRDKSVQPDVAQKPLETPAGPRILPQFTLPTTKAPQEKDPANKRLLQAPELADIFSSDDKSRSVSLQPRPPPPPPIPPAVGSASYQLRPPPPLPGASSEDETTNLRTIFTTGIAKATDLTTAGGNAELAHIFLQDHHPDLDKQEWSIGLSPSKKASGAPSKGIGRFVRGGLAARAFDVKQRDQTDLVLWQKEIEAKLSSTSTKRIGSHLCLRIVEILDRPTGPKPTSPRRRKAFKQSGEEFSLTAPGLAICRIISNAPPPCLTLDSARSSSTSHTPPALLHAFEKRREQNILVVLSFPRTAPSALEKQNKVYARNPESLAEGTEVHLWEPWREVSLKTSQDDTPDKADMDVDEEGEDKETRAYIPRPFPLPLSLPRSTQSSQPGADKPLADVVLLCDRFVIMT